MIVNVRHPAVIRHVPAGGRHERVDVVAMETPVELVHADRGAFRRIEGLGDLSETLAIEEGHLWLQMRQPHYQGDRAYTAPELVAWLRGDRAGEAKGLDLLLRRTPLLAAVTRITAGGFVEHGSSRGEGRSPKSRDVSWDGRPTAPARLAAWVAANVRIVRNTAWLRVAPLASLDRLASQNHVILDVLHGHSLSMTRPGFSVDRIAEADRIAPAPGGINVDPAVARIVGLLQDGAHRPDGTRQLALSLPGAVQDSAVRLPRLGVPVPPALVDVAQALKPHADAAMTGFVEDGDVPAVLALCEAAAEILARLGPPIDHEPWRKVRAHFRSGLLPGFGAPHAEDEDALDALSHQGAPAPGGRP